MRTRPLCFVCLIFLLFQSVFLWIFGGDSLYEVPADSVFSGGPGRTLKIQGQVYKKSKTSNYQMLYLKNNSVNDTTILVYEDSFTEIPIGKTIYIKGTTGCFERARNPGNFDAAKYYAKQRIYGYLWCEEILQMSGKEDHLKEMLFRLRKACKETFIETIGEKNGEVLSAILLGEKSELDANVKELYQSSGISHILAISGLHISFIGLGIYKLLRKTGFSITLSGVLGILVLSLYVFMIGWSVSIFRAYVMFLLRVGADLTGRVYDLFTGAFLAAGFTVLYQPLYLTDGGFWMSYGAILGIALILPALQKLFFVKSWWLSLLFDAFMASVAVTIMLFPITLLYYYEFPLYSVFLNVLVIPLMSLVLGFGLIGSLLHFIFPIPGSFCLQISNLILNFYEWICEGVLELPYARLVIGKPEWWELLFYYGILILILCFVKNQKLSRKERKYRPRLWLLLGIAVLFMSLSPAGNLKVVMVDVGQGDCLFVRGPNKQTYLIDGGSSDVKDLSKYRIEPFLKSQGVGVIDYVFVTHGDIDHYSGILEMMERRKIGVGIRNLVVAANYREDPVLCELLTVAKEAGVCTWVMEAGEVISEGNVSFRSIQPSGEDDKLSGNEGSLVLEITYGNFSMLCTGDVEGAGEDCLQKKLSGKTYDVLKVSHHGSKNATTKAFLEIVQPKIAVISAGKNNSYGHPHQETILRLEEADCEIFMTPKSGAIILTTDGKFIDILPTFI